MSVEQGMALLQAVIGSADPAHKVVYADWLEERGEDDLAHAYRWAASRTKHPLFIRGEHRPFAWSHPLQGQNRPPPHCLPQVVFDSVPQRGARLFKRFNSIHIAFARLAEALAYLRRVSAPLPLRKQ